jgi:hypothetical protein
LHSGDDAFRSISGFPAASSAADVAAAAAFLFRCRIQKMTTAQPQIKTRQPNIPPIMAPVLFVPLLLGGGGWAFGSDEMLDSGNGVVLGLLGWDVSGRVGCAVLLAVVSRGKWALMMRRG